MAMAAPLGEQAWQRTPARQTTSSFPESVRHLVPVLPRCFRNGTRGRRPPTAGTLVVVVGPHEDLLDHQRRRSLAVARTTPLGQQLHQGRATGQTTKAGAQRLVEVFPFFSVRAWDEAWRSGSGPCSR